MKKAALFILAVYQVILSPLIHAVTGTTHACRYSVTCSQYARQSIEKYGAPRGSLMALKRLASCHPFAKVALNKV